MEKRKFVNLKKQMSEVELNKFCKKIAEEYANYPAEYARSYFSEKYNVTVSCFYTILKYTVTRSLVEDVVVQKMMKKSILNQNIHKNGAGASSVIKYAILYQKRDKYIAETMQEETVKKIAEDFGSNPNISKADFAASYGISKRAIDYTLQRAILEKIANDEEVKQIEKRSIINSKKEKEEAVIKYFEILKKKREENAKK